MLTTSTFDLGSVLIKTVSEACNLACDYCYYSSCNGIPNPINKVEDKTLEKFIREYMTIKRGIVPFAWQGGEPLLAGLDFFKKVVHFQAKYAPNNTIISNSIQTNGLLINKEWATFFKQFGFLVGVSLDGPEQIHNKRRVTHAGKGSFKLTMRGIQYLKEESVEFNILTVLHEDNIFKAAELMNFYQDNGFTHIQFLPGMDFRAQETNKSAKYLITPKQYGDFLCETFDVWYNDGFPIMSVRFFDNMLAVYLHQQAELCIHQETCPKSLIFEQNGDAYPCDFYINEDYKLGNVNEVPLEQLLDNSRMDNFLMKKQYLSEKCKSCEFIHLCNGGCPRNRVSNDHDIAIEYFCESYQQFYRYAHERMLQVANNIKRERIHTFRNTGNNLPKRNEMCLCGSQKKYKNCCYKLLED
ncbi:anaerobic sulfatase maturase [Neobacillus niacini]|uniref:anaerobic sulfatase maturase n=1 Tax=Neobacillus niacini TaxID=86668 RepID=UPI00300335D3